MLSEKYPSDAIREMLVPRDAWRPFPSASRREAWEELPAAVREAHVERGEQALGFEWPPLSAIRFLDYVRDGDRERYQGLSFARRTALRDLALAECTEGAGRFVDDIVNGVWAICEESFWGVPAHIGVQKAGRGLPDTAEPTVDLFAAETSALLCWVSYLLGSQLDAISPLIRPRVHREVDARILTPLLERDDFGWMGFGNGGRRVNNWNPWINSNWLTSALLLEPDTERRVAAVVKSMKSLDNFIDPYPKDGGCDEGPGYWGRAGASLFDCLELLRSATDGKIDVYDEALVQEIGRFIYRVQICDECFVNFADAPAVTHPADAVVYGYGKRIGDEDLQAFGAWLARDPDTSRRASLGRLLPGLFDFPERAAAEARQPLPRDVWLDEIQVMVARDQGGTAEGLFLAAKGGHNAESHNHNDVGSFVVYADGRPVIVDAGVETYTAKTFSSTRYDIWTMQSAFHSLLPTIDGVMQEAGMEFAARGVGYAADDASAELTLDIARAYPPAARLESWVRTVRLTRGVDVGIEDRYELARPVAEITLSLLTPCEVGMEGSGRIGLQEAEMVAGRRSGSGSIVYDADTMEASVEEFALTDGKLRGIWGGCLNRVVFRMREPAQKGSVVVRIEQR
jgi:hypothetical protein